MSEISDDVRPRKIGYQQQQQQQQRRSYGGGVNGRGGGRSAGGRNRNNNSTNTNHNNHNSVSNGRHRESSQNNEKELASQQIQIQSKRFYIDVKENQRGRFIKLAEIGSGGRKSRILMTTGAAVEFKNHLSEFSELNAQMGPVPPTDAAEVTANGGGESGDGEAHVVKKETSTDSDGLIKSETFLKDRKRYYLDFKENQRGRFLKVSMIMNQGRSQIAIPAQGLAEFKEQLAEILEKYGVDEETDETDGVNNENEDERTAAMSQALANLPESESLKADSKTFYFDCDANARGIFLKISEVRQSNRYRTSITVPDNALKQFKETLNEFIDKSIAAMEAAGISCESSATTNTAAVAAAAAAAAATATAAEVASSDAATPASSAANATAGPAATATN